MVSYLDLQQQRGNYIPTIATTSDAVAENLARLQSAQFNPTTDANGRVQFSNPLANSPQSGLVPITDQYGRTQYVRPEQLQTKKANPSVTVPNRGGALAASQANRGTTVPSTSGSGGSGSTQQLLTAAGAGGGAAAALKAVSKLADKDLLDSAYDAIFGTAAPAASTAIAGAPNLGTAGQLDQLIRNNQAAAAAGGAVPGANPGFAPGLSNPSPYGAGPNLSGQVTQQIQNLQSASANGASIPGAHPGFVPGLSDTTSYVQGIAQGQLGQNLTAFNSAGGAVQGAAPWAAPGLSSAAGGAGAASQLSSNLTAFANAGGNIAGATPGFVPGLSSGFNAAAQAATNTTAFANAGGAISGATPGFVPGLTPALPIDQVGAAASGGSGLSLPSWGTVSTALSALGGGLAAYDLFKNGPNVGNLTGLAGAGLALAGAGPAGAAVAAVGALLQTFGSGKPSVGPSAHVNFTMPTQENGRFAVSHVGADNGGPESYIRDVGVIATDGANGLLDQFGFNIDYDALAAAQQRTPALYAAVTTRPDLGAGSTSAGQWIKRMIDDGVLVAPTDLPQGFESQEAYNEQLRSYLTNVVTMEKAVWDRFRQMIEQSIRDGNTLGQIQRHGADASNPEHRRLAGQTQGAEFKQVTYDPRDGAQWTQVAQDGRQ